MGGFWILTDLSQIFFEIFRVPPIWGTPRSHRSKTDIGENQRITLECQKEILPLHRNSSMGR